MRIGIDLGGTKIEGIAIGDSGDECVRLRIPAPRDDYDATLSAIVGLVRDVEQHAGERGTIGVGIPGTISPATGLVKNANSTWLNGQPLGDDLPRLLDRPVRFANDANCFALSEATDGAAADAHSVFGVIVGTGTGGGLVLNGRVVTGANAIAGEWGHNPLPAPRDDERPGPACYCGRRGCIETFLSGPGLSRDYACTRGGHGDGEGDRGAARTKGNRRRARRSRATRNGWRARSARSSTSLDPDVIVLGGGLSNIERLYESVPRLWAAYVFSDRVDTRLVRAKHGDSSGVRGAAWLWNE